MITERDIEAYFLGKLPLNEKITLETALQNDNQFKKKVEEFRNDLHDLENLGRIFSLEELDKWKLFNETTAVHKDKKINRKGPFVLGPTVGYSITFLVIALVAFMTDNYDPVKNFSNSRMFSLYFEPISVTNLYSDSEYSNMDRRKFSVIERYTSREYDSTIIMLRDAADLEGNDNALNLLEGISQLETGNVESAIKELNEVIIKNDEYKQHAQWYLALAYLKNNDLQKCKDQLLVLSNGNGNYKRQSNELLMLLTPLTNDANIVK